MSTQWKNRKAKKGKVIASVGVVVVLIGGVAVFAATRKDSVVAPEIPETTFPNPPGKLESAQEIVDGAERTTFTSTLAPTKIVDNYLQSFALIGWTTLKKEGDDTRSVLQLQGGNRYATIVVERTDKTSDGVVCQGIDQKVVNSCALGDGK